MRISDWSSDVCSSDLYIDVEEDFAAACAGTIVQPEGCVEIDPGEARAVVATFTDDDLIVGSRARWNRAMLSIASEEWRSEEHTSELQSLMRISYAVF